MIVSCLLREACFNSAVVVFVGLFTIFGCKINEDEIITG